MTEERVSAALVPAAQGVGILTDRDFRSRVLAAGAAAEALVREVMTFPVVTAPDDATAEEVLLLMLEHGFHHVPITDREGKIVGVVSDGDLLGLERSGPFSLHREIERAPTERSVAAAAARLPEIVVALVEAEADPVDIGHVIATAIDALTRQLIDLSLRDLGEPPGSWAWLALGSEARQEQSLRTDPGPRTRLRPGIRHGAGGRSLFRPARGPGNPWTRGGRDPPLQWWGYGDEPFLASPGIRLGGRVPGPPGRSRARRQGIHEHRP
jgi:signal-transduction protein with cAMP-binding, CBS, and nucleotidyltransferase domain